MNEKRKMTEEALEKVYKETLFTLEEDLEGFGVCDHSVGVCYCSHKYLCDNYRLLLGLPLIDYSNKNWIKQRYNYDFAR